MNLLPFFAPISGELETIERRMIATVRETYEPLSSALCAVLESGGKRLRPALVVLAAHLHQWEPAPTLALAAAVEMLHTATLIHDDTIDQATLRRGHETLNATWNRSASILAGDYLFARAAALAAETGNTRVATLFAQTLTTICQGEVRQMLSLYRWRDGREDYYERIYAKTASLFAASCEAGALLSRAPEEAIDALRHYGRQLGMAFQIVDDILDFAGSEDQLGKPTGADLRQGIATLPVYYFLQNGGSEALVEAALDRTCEDRARREEALQTLTAAVAASPAIEACRQEAEHFAQQAVAALDPWPSGPYSRALRELAHFVVARDL